MLYHLKKSKLNFNIYCHLTFFTFFISLFISLLPAKGSTDALGTSSKQLISEEDKALGRYSENGAFGEITFLSNAAQIVVYFSSSTLSKIYHRDIGDPFKLTNTERNTLKEEALMYFSSIFALQINKKPVEKCFRSGVWVDGGIAE